MRTVKWGVLGTAGIAKGCTIPGMVEAENAVLYAIAGRNPEKVEAYRQAFGFEKGYLSYEELLEDPEVEAVYIPLPNHLHYEWAMKAMEHGKHVLCEKPLAPTARETEELMAAAAQRGVILMEAFAYLHSPFITEMKKVLDSGVIGDVLYMESAFITSDYVPENIRVRRETFGGSIYDLGCYNTSLILWMLEEDPEDVQTISCWSSENIDLYTSAVLSFKGRRRAAFSCGMVLATEQDRRLDRWQIHGTKGVIRTTSPFNGAGKLSFEVVTEAGTETHTVSVPQNYRLEVEQLGRCITEGEKP